MVDDQDQRREPPSTTVLSPPPTIHHRPLSTIHRPPSTVHHSPSTQRRPQCTAVTCPPSTTYCGGLFTVHFPLSTLYSTVSFILLLSLFCNTVAIHDSMAWARFGHSEFSLPSAYLDGSWNNCHYLTIFFQTNTGYEYAEMCGTAGQQQVLTSDPSVMRPGATPPAVSRSRPWHDFGRQTEVDKIHIPKM